MVGADGSTGPAGRREPLPRSLLGVLIAAVLAETIYVLLFSPFPMTDAAAHIGSSAALVDTIGGFELGDRFLEWNPWPAPNVLASLVLAILLPVVGVEWAERLVLAGYVVALPFATLYAVRALRPGHGWLACFAVPLTFSLCALWGFFNFSYSIVAFLLTAGFLLRSPVRMSSGRTATLSALLLLTFFAHFVAYAVACIFVVSVLGFRALFVPGSRLRIVGHGVAALAPGLALAVAYLASSGSAEGAAWSYSLARKLAGTLTATWGLVTYDRLEIVLGLALALTLGVLVVLGAIRVRPWDERNPDTLAVGAFTLLLAILAVVSPDDVGSGGSFISHRLALFPVFGALLWLAAQDLRRTHVIVGAGVALAVAAGLAAVRYDELREVERIAEDLAPVARCVAPERTLVQGNLVRLPISYGDRIDVLTNEAGRVAAATDGLDLLNVDLRAPQWVQRFREETSAAEHLVLPDAYVVDVPPPLDFAAYERSTGATIDYVLLFGRPRLSGETTSSPGWRPFDRSLREGYRLQLRSPGRWWELWVARGAQIRLPESCRVPVST